MKNCNCTIELKVPDFKNDSEKAAWVFNLPQDIYEFYSSNKTYDYVRLSSLSKKHPKYFKINDNRTKNF